MSEPSLTVGLLPRFALAVFGEVFALQVER